MILLSNARNTGRKTKGNNSVLNTLTLKSYYPSLYPQDNFRTEVCTQERRLLPGEVREDGMCAMCKAETSRKSFQANLDVGAQVSSVRPSGMHLPHMAFVMDFAFISLLLFKIIFILKKICST